MITIECEQGTATLEGGEWTSETEELATYLNSIAWDILLGPGYYPSRDHAIAEKAVELVDGDITEADEPEFDPDVIY